VNAAGDLLDTWPGADDRRQFCCRLSAILASRVPWLPDRILSARQTATV
jgi:hypothetical protein